MTLPYEEHNSLIATRAFLEDLSNEDKLIDVPQKIKLNALQLLKTFPTREKLNELYKGQTIEDLLSISNGDAADNPNKVVNDNQTWETPGFRWKTEVEFVSAGS